MKKLITITIALGLALLHMNAQDVGSLTLGNKYRRADVEKEFGKPASIEGTDWNDYMTFRYEGLTLAFAEGGELWSLTVTSPKYPLFKSSVDGGLKVGDPIGRIFHVRGGYPKKGDTPNEYHLFTKDDSIAVCVFYDRSTEKIIKINYYILG